MKIFKSFKWYIKRNNRISELGYFHFFPPFLYFSAYLIVNNIFHFKTFFFAYIMFIISKNKTNFLCLLFLFHWPITKWETSLQTCITLIISLIKLADVPITDSDCYANLSDIQHFTTELPQRSGQCIRKCLITFWFASILRFHAPISVLWCKIFIFFMNQN